MKSRQELTVVTARRYRKAKRPEKVKMLDEFVAGTGYNRGYGATLLRTYGLRKNIPTEGGTTRLVTKKRKRKAGGRPKIYGKTETAMPAMTRRRPWIPWTSIGQCTKQSSNTSSAADVDHLQEQLFLLAAKPFPMAQVMG